LLTTDKQALSFGIQSVDQTFQGVKPGNLTVLYDHPVCKNLIFRLCVRCQLPETKGGLDSSSIYVDGGNSFNPYEISAIAREHGSDPKSTLERVFISRAFTAYQLSAIVSETLEDALKRYKPKLVLISKITSLFLDRDVPPKEAVELFKKMTLHLTDLALKRNIIIVATCINDEPSKRQIVLESILLRTADKNARFIETKGRLQLSIRSRDSAEILTADITRDEATLEKFVEA
jgi:RecA/RadA recombinase